MGVYTCSLQVGPNYQCASDQCRPVFVQSHSQSQARLTFVTILEMDNLDCTKFNPYFEKFTVCQHNHC